MSETKHYKILQATSLINEQQLEEQSEDGWILLQIIEKDGSYFYYFYRN